MRVGGTRRRARLGHRPGRRQRLVDLNQQAAAFYTARYPGSWAANYLHARLGDDPARRPRFTLGYAPAGWTALTDHLRRHGATDDELLAAGLAKPRLHRPAHRPLPRPAHPAHPHHDDDHRRLHRPAQPHPRPRRRRDRAAGPKYLNTAAHRPVHKGAQLYGLHEGRAGSPPAPPRCWSKAPSTPSPSPSPATADTSASPRWAPPSPTPKPTRSSPTSAPATPASSSPPTPTPPAAAAERDYWQLTARGDNPATSPARRARPRQHPATPRRRRPTHRPRRGHPARRPAHPKARRSTSAWPRRRPPGRHPQRRGNHRRAPARPVATPHRHPHRHVDAVPGAAYLAVTDAGSAWTHDPHGQARRRITAIPDQPPPAAASAKALPAPVADVSTNAAARWEHLAATISPTLTADPAWAELWPASQISDTGPYRVRTGMEDGKCQNGAGSIRPSLRTRR